MNPIQAAIAKISGIARQKFGDNQGWIQNNRISAQPLKQSLYNAGRNVANTPITDIVPAYRNLRQTTQKYNPQAWQSVPTLKSMWQDPTSIPVFGGTYRTAKPIIDYLNPSGYGQDDFGKFKGAMKAMPATAVNLFGTSKLTGAGVVGAGVVGGAFNKLTGGSFSQGAKAGMDMAPSLAGVGAFTNPLIAKGANLVGAKFANPIARQIASRVAVGVGNIPEGMLFRGAGGGGAYGIKDAATDFAFGTVAGSPVAHGIKDSRVKNLVDETKGLSDISDPVQNELYSEMRSAQTKVMDKIKLLRGKYKTDANIPRVIKKELDILKNDWQVKAGQGNQATRISDYPLLQEARKYKTPEEFVASQDKLLHGTSKKFDDFDISKRGMNEKDIQSQNSTFFTDSLDTAKSYGKYIQERYGKFDKPLVIDAKGEMYSGGSSSTDMKQVLREAVEKAQKEGYDVVIVKNLSDRKDWGTYEPATHYAVLDMNKLKTKSQLTDIWNKAHGKAQTIVPDNVVAPGASKQSAEDPILSEARKYKTPEEFVRAQGEVVYHGTDTYGSNSILKDGFKIMSTGNAESGISLSPNKNISSIFSGKDGKILDVVISPNTKLMTGNDFDAILAKLVRENKMPYKTKQEQAVVDSLAAKEAKKFGYDGVDWRGQSEGIESLSDEIRIWNTDKIKTKSQLTDIWNKANNVGGIKRSPPVEVSGGVAGIEQYQDKQGNTQYRFNPIKGAAGIVGVKLAKDGKIRAFTQPDVKKLSAQELKEQLQVAQNNAQQAMEHKEYVDGVWGRFLPETQKAIGKIRTQLNNLEAKGADMTNVSLSSAYKKSFDDVMATLGTNSEDEALTFIKNMPDRKVKGATQEIKTANQLFKEMERRQAIANQPLNSETVGQSLSDMVTEGYDPKTLKERGFTETIRKAQISQDRLKEGSRAMYEPITNPKTLKQAKESIADDITAARDRVFEEEFSAETSAIGQELIRKYQEKGDWTQAINMIEVLAQKATKAGQANQALSMWSRFTPEGMLKFAERTIKKANEDQGIITKGVRKAMGFLPTKLDELTAKNITELMDKANKSTSEDDKIKYTRLAMEEISSRLPYGINDLIDEMRYNNMLSGPLTHVRNAWSNSLQVGATRPLTILFQGKPKEVVQYYRGVVTAIPTAVNKAIDSMKGNVPYRALDVELKQGLRPKPRLGLYNIPTRLLEASDQFFGTMVKSGEMARGESKEKAEMLAEALLFRGRTKPKGQGHLLNKIDDITSAISTLRRVGLGWAVPFLRTPMNVAKQWIEYSPAGVLTLPGSQNKKEQLAKMMIGSTVTMMGVKLAMEGRTTWSAPTDPTEKKLFYDSGRKPYSVKVGDKWVPMQYFGTFAWAMGLPAAMQYYQKEQRNALTDDQMTKIGKGLLSLGGFWSNQTFVSGLGSFVNVMQGKDDYTLSKTLGYTVGQLNPMAGLQRYIATVIDPIFRKPKGFVQQLQSGIPIMSKQLAPYETSTGEPARRDITNYIAPYPVGTVKQEFEDKYQQRKQRMQENAYINAYTSDKPNISPVLRQKAESMETDRKAQDKFTYYTAKLDAYNQTKDKKAGASLYYGIKNSKTLTPEMKDELLRDLPVPESKSKTKQLTTQAKTASKTKKTRVKGARIVKTKKIKTPKLSSKLPKAKKTKATKVKTAKIKPMKPPKLAKVKAITRSSLTQA